MSAGCTANEALANFQRDRAKEGSHVCLVLALGKNGFLAPWIAAGIDDETYAAMLDDIARWAAASAKLYRPAGRA